MNRPPPRRGAPAEAAAFVDTIGDHEAFTPALRGGAYYDGQVPGHGDSWRRAVRPGPRFFNRTSNKKFTPIGAISACWYVTGMSGYAFAMPIGLRLPRGPATLHL